MAVGTAISTIASLAKDQRPWSPQLQITLRPHWPTTSLSVVRGNAFGVTGLKLTNPPGIDREQLLWDDEEDLAARAVSSQTEPTIAEDALAEAEEGIPEISTPTTPRHVKRSSQNRLSRLSDDKRLSTSSTRFVEGKGTDSNRSSTTIKGSQVNGTNGFNEADFDRALRKFATERDSFLADLTLSAGAIVKSQPKPRPRTQKIVSDDGSNLKSGLGSIRRRISFREMNSIKRQPSNARQGKRNTPTRH